MQITGLHHVTAVTADAPQNMNFYTKVLGLRLVKKTVNQDDVSAYHLFYADAKGSPGTDMTFFDWTQAAPRHVDTDALTTTLFRVNGQVALDWWANRFDQLGVGYRPGETLAGRAGIFLTDPEGQQLALVDDGGADTQAEVWTGNGVPFEYGIRGFQAIRLNIPHRSQVESILTLLGFNEPTQVEDSVDGSLWLYSIDGGGPGKELQLVEHDGEEAYGSTAGSIHHVAWRVQDETALKGWLGQFEQAGVRNSGIVERFYFKSLYFRISPGILFELATEGPGFAADEAVEHLGEKLSLPPFLESQRTEIESGLPPLD